METKFFINFFSCLGLVKFCLKPCSFNRWLDLHETENIDVYCYYPQHEIFCSFYFRENGGHFLKMWIFAQVNHLMDSYEIENLGWLVCMECGFQLWSNQII